jgi:hypothetical protein
MLNNVLNVQVSDTTGDDSSSVAKFIKSFAHPQIAKSAHQLISFCYSSVIPSLSQYHVHGFLSYLH